jgi:hypothetical protein
MHNCFLLLRLICGIRRLQQINKTKSVIEIAYFLNPVSKRPERT